MDDVSDELLAERIAAGSIEAFEALVARHHSRYYRIAYRFLLSREDAEDMVQEAFLKLWTGSARYDIKKKAKFTSWFTHIVVNQARDILRKRQRQKAEPIEDNELSEAASQVFALEQRESRDAVAAALDALPDRQRMAVVLYYYGDVPQQEAAKMMKLSVKGFESLLSRAKASLRQAEELRNAG